MDVAISRNSAGVRSAATSSAPASAAAMSFRAGRVVAWVCAGVRVFGIVWLFIIWVGTSSGQWDIDYLSVASGEQHDVSAALHLDVASLCVSMQTLRKPFWGV